MLRFSRHQFFVSHFSLISIIGEGLNGCSVSGRERFQAAVQCAAARISACVRSYVDLVDGDGESAGDRLAGFRRLAGQRGHQADLDRLGREQRARKPESECGCGKAQEGAAWNGAN